MHFTGTCKFTAAFPLRHEILRDVKHVQDTARLVAKVGPHLLSWHTRYLDQTLFVNYVYITQGASIDRR